MIWDANLFSTNSLASSSVVELELTSELAIEALSEKPTVVRVYGGIIFYAIGTAGQQANYAWGIRLKEADATTTTTAFAPAIDGDSSNWITWGAGTVIVAPSGRADLAGSRLMVRYEQLDIKNPRIAQPDEELVLIIQSLSTSDAALGFNAWNRVGYLLT